MIKHYTKFEREHPFTIRLIALLILGCFLMLFFVIAYSVSPPTDLEGQWIAFTCIRNPGHDATTSLYIVRSDGSELRRLLGDTKNRIRSPDWSPDGQWIAFGYGSGIQIIHGNGTGRRTITDGSSLLGYPSWSPDSREIVFSVATAIFKFNLDTGELQELVSYYNVSAPEWSPNSDWIVFNYYETLYLIRSDGTRLYPYSGRKKVGDVS